MLRDEGMAVIGDVRTNDKATVAKAVEVDGPRETRSDRFFRSDELRPERHSEYRSR